MDACRPPSRKATDGQAGSNEKVQKGKDILIWATIGLVVIFASYAMVKFVIEGIAVKQPADGTKVNIEYIHFA